MLIRSKRHQQPIWGSYQGGPQSRSIDDTTSSLTLSLLQHPDNLGTKITFNPPALIPESMPITNDIIDHIDKITMDQQRLVNKIGIAHINDLAQPEDRHWTSISYAYPNCNPS